MSTRNMASVRRDELINRSARRTPAKKNTRRWCRGRVGVEHDPAVRDHMWYRRLPDPGRPACYWYQWGRNPHWQCGEERYCTMCGKILQFPLGKDCTRRPEPTTTPKD